MNFIKRLWKEEDGAETAEWVVIVALLVVVALLIYNNILKDALQTVVENIESDITTL